MSGTTGWSLVSDQRKREIIAAIRDGDATRGPVHAELDLTDRCNVSCYFCNQMDLRTKESLPIARFQELLDELVTGGLKSVRLSGGGDPLVYSHITDVLDLLASEGVVVDNLTTNGALLKPEIAERLVAGRAREVIFSLNAADPDDYQRMMRVRGATFDRVCENIRHLVDRRGGQELPTVVVQFLIDPVNYRRLPEMYRLGCSLGADFVAINPVLEIPQGRLDETPLFGAEDHRRVRPYLAQILTASGGADRLQLCFPWPQWNAAVEELRQELATPAMERHGVAPSFDEERNGQCFFAWYSATIRGTGELYPCCMLLNPEYAPLGNALEGGFRRQWLKGGFAALRREMREVMLRRGRMFALQSRLPHLRPQCVIAHRCAHKTAYFRGDDSFYRELDETLAELRRREVRWWGQPHQIARAVEVLAFRIYHGVQVRTTKLLQRLGTPRWALKLKRRRYLHIGPNDRGLAGWLHVATNGSSNGTRRPRVRGARAILAEEILEELEPEAALDFLQETRRALARDGVLRLSTLNAAWVASHPSAPSNAKDRYRSLWSRSTLTQALEACGFTELDWPSYGQSRQPELRHIDGARAYADSPNEPSVLIVEARRGADCPDRLATLRRTLDSQRSPA